MAQDDALSYLDRRGFLQTVVGGATALTIGQVLAGCGGGGGGNSPTTQANLRLSLSPVGPAAANMSVSIGGQVVVTPSVSGNITYRSTTTGTSIVVATENTTNAPLLLAIVPQNASGSPAAPILVSPKSTVYALMFLRTGAWLIPQIKHQQFFDTIALDPQVAAAVSTFEAAYNANGRALANITTESGMVAAMQSATNATVVQLSASPLLADMMTAIGTIPSSRSRSRSIHIKGIDASVQITASGSSLLASNNAGVYRWIEIDGGNTLQSNTVLLPEASTISSTLRPSPIPEASQLSVIVTGGLQGFDINGGDLDEKHIVPTGVTELLQIVLPLVGIFIDVAHANPPPETGFPTGDPLLDVMFKLLVFDHSNPASFPQLATADLIQRLLLLISANQAFGFWQIIDLFTGWLNEKVFAAIRENADVIAKAAIQEAALAGRTLSESAVNHALNVLPVIGEIFLAYHVISAGIDVNLSATLLTNTPATSVFTVTQGGDIGVVIKSVNPADVLTHKWGQL